MKFIYITILLVVSALSIPIDAQVMKLKHGESRYAAICFTPENKQIITASFGNDGMVRGWNAANGKQLWEIDLRKSADSTLYDFVDVFSMDVSPDGQYVAVGFDRSSRKDSGTSTKPEDLIEIYDITTRKSLITLRGHTNLIGSISFSPDGKALAAVDSDGKAIIWNIETGQPLLSMSFINRGRLVKFSPDGKMIAVMSADATVPKVNDTGISLFDAETGKLLRQIPRPHYVDSPVNETTEK